ncbi:hypothetical protein AB7849_09145 [Rhodanobacter sp. 115]|uniref:hypothetical protein n=1 Tax=Rhodanobacter sp. FW021-MT20 TaxID=1162282 RepID=UPI000260D304|nr:hypothetical protein [Rhodanobacter sp. 115]EIL88436.1 hypothetical protein UU5_17147 [Rhodanobacter sp. 115]
MKACATGLLFGVALGTLAGCHGSSQAVMSISKMPAQAASARQPAASPTADAPTRLDRLFVHDAIGSNIAWFESIAGPAMQMLDNGDGSQARLYRVDGCHVMATATGSTISALTLQLAPRCSVPLSAMLPNAPAMNLATLRFAALFKAGASDIGLACAGFAECGNASDPSVQASLGGSQADGFLMVDFSGSITTDADVAALQQVMAIEATRLGKSGPDLDAAAYDHDPQLPALIQARLGNVKVDTITFHASP